MSWTFLNTRPETFTKASQEGFVLKADLSITKEAIETTQQRHSFSTPENESSKGDLGKDD